MTEWRDPRFNELDRLIRAGEGDARRIARVNPSGGIPGRPRTLKEHPRKPGVDWARLSSKFNFPDTYKIAEICKAVEDAYGYQHGTLKQTSGSRQERYMHPRHVVIYLARLTTDLSSTRIAEYFGLDHSTILHAVQVMRGCIEHSREVADFVYALVVSLKTQLQRKPASSADRSIDQLDQACNGPSPR